MSSQKVVLSQYEKQELEEYLQDARNLKGLRKGLYIIFMRYLQVMTDSAHGIDVEIDSDFFYDFANLLEVLLILSPDPLDQEITHFKP
jgi:hypothetical protein